jgi:hypothetical protein
MESLLSIFRMHWDHEPETHKRLEINECVLRFMKETDLVRARREPRPTSLARTLVASFVTRLAQVLCQGSLRRVSR